MPSPQNEAINQNKELPNMMTQAKIRTLTIAQLKEFLNDEYEPEDLKSLKKAELVDLAIEIVDEKNNPTPASDDDEVDDELPADDEIDDELPEEDDEVDDEEDDDEPISTMTAKQVATRLGTDAKTLRKFFRSSASTVEPVGQGGRYEFDANDIGQIKTEFNTWNSTKRTRTPGASSKSKGKEAARERQAEVEEVEAEELELDDEEPEEDDLEELDDLDLELDDEEDD